MFKVFIFILLCILLGAAGCQSRDKSAAPDNETRPQGALSPHAAPVTSSTKKTKGTTTPLAEQIKEKKLNLSSSKTVGDVFGSYRYAVKSEWRETITSSGVIYVDYVCQLDPGSFSAVAKRDGVVQRILDVKFSIRDNGEAYVALISVTDTSTDGKLITTNYQSDEVMLKIVKAIYDNEKPPI